MIVESMLYWDTLLMIDNDYISKPLICASIIDYLGYLIDWPNLLEQ